MLQTLTSMLQQTTDPGLVYTFAKEEVLVCASMLLSVFAVCSFAFKTDE